MSDSARALIAGATDLSPEEIWHRIEIRDGMMEGESGATVSLSGASWRQAELAEEVLSQSPDPERGLELGDAVDAWLADSNDAPDLLDLSIQTDRSWFTLFSTSYQQDLAAIRGEVTSLAAWREVRSEAIASRIELGTLALGPVLDELDAAGAIVVDYNVQSGVVHALLPKDQLAELLLVPELTRVDMDSGSGVEDAGISMTVSGSLDGIETEDMLQSWHYYNEGYRGDPNDQVIISDAAGLDITNLHPEFFDGSAARKVIACGGTTSTCTDQANSSGGPHATQVASILLGDLTLGQDSNVSLLFSQRGPAAEWRAGRVASRSTKVPATG